jgi:hypothetical protein
MTLDCSEDNRSVESDRMIDLQPQNRPNLFVEREIDGRADWEYLLQQGMTKSVLGWLGWDIGGDEKRMARVQEGNGSKKQTVVVIGDVIVASSHNNHHRHARDHGPDQRRIETVR